MACRCGIEDNMVVVARRFVACEEAGELVERGDFGCAGSRQLFGNVGKVGR